MIFHLYSNLFPSYFQNYVGTGNAKNSFLGGIEQKFRKLSLFYVFNEKRQSSETFFFNSWLSDIICFVFFFQVISEVVIFIIFSEILKNSGLRSG